MAETIVPTGFPENIARELKVDAKGRIYTTRRGLSRILNVTPQAIGQFLRVNEIVPEETETIDAIAFEGVNELLTESQVRRSAKHFAFKSRKTTMEAERFFDLIAAVGWRTLGQKLLGYQPVERRKLTASEIIELCCLPVPSQWQRRFPEEFYAELSRLTGLSSFGNSRPTLWAAKTKELVYDFLPTGVYEEIKRCKAETGSYDKLHQFLSEDGLQILEQHQRQLLMLMQASASLAQLKVLLTQSCSKTYQLVLIGA